MEMSGFDDVDTLLMPPPNKRFRSGTYGTKPLPPVNKDLEVLVIERNRVIPWQTSMSKPQVECDLEQAYTRPLEDHEAIEVSEQQRQANESNGCSISQDSASMEGSQNDIHDQPNRRGRCSITNKVNSKGHPDEYEQDVEDESTLLTHVTTRFSDIIGHGSVKVRIDEILLPLALPSNLTNSILRGIRAMPASMLLYGPPGCGKTQLARAVAGEAQAAFMSIGPSDVLSKFVGESEASIRDLFKKASRLASRTESRCTVLFFDEIDAIGQVRGGGDENGGLASSGSSDGSSRRILAELLIQMTNIIKSDRCHDYLSAEDNERNNFKQGGYDSCGDDDEIMDSRSTLCAVKVIIVAATNRIEDCDPALLRRFSIRLHVGLPTKRDRMKIMNKHLSDIDNSLSQIQLEEIGHATEGWSGSDLESLTREAAMAPIRECLRFAARAKRQTKKQEQSGGDESSQENVHKIKDADEVARCLLLKGFQNIRDVCFQDFEDAVSFLLGTNERQRVSTQSVLQQLQHRRQMYDSSSDSGSESN